MMHRRGYRGNRLTMEDHVAIQRDVAAGKPFPEAAAGVGCSIRSVGRVVARLGGIVPRGPERSPLRLSLSEREELSRGLVEGESLRSIAKRLGRAPSTVSREVNGNGGRAEYRAWQAERNSRARGRRPKPSKLTLHAPLLRAVERGLNERWAPQQITARLVSDYPDDLRMRVSHETIYRSLFIQARGALRKELTACLRTGRATRRSHKRTDLSGGSRLRDMVMISERPAEVEDRAVPGHWEGDLIIGKGGKSAVGTLVERSSRYVALLHLPDGRTAGDVRKALRKVLGRFPSELRRTLTWDQGIEMAEHVRFSIDSDIDVYFCDPRSPWQRGSNENTNGLLRQYFPKGTDLSVHSQAALNRVARELNGRPRQTLGWMKPCEVFGRSVALSA
jgi:IS30 family transposase